MPEYAVRYEFRAEVRLQIEANSEEDARHAGFAKAEEKAKSKLQFFYANVRRVSPSGEPDSGE